MTLQEHKGLFYKENRLYIPRDQTLRLQVIQEYHDSNGTHFGYKKTLATITRSYYWEKMPRDVLQFVKSCDTCQWNKPSTQKPYGLLQPIEPPMDKFEAYSMDFIGPLPKTKAGNNGILVIVDMLSKA